MYICMSMDLFFIWKRMKDCCTRPKKKDLSLRISLWSPWIKMTTLEEDNLLSLSSTFGSVREESFISNAATTFRFAVSSFHTRTHIHMYIHSCLKNFWLIFKLQFLKTTPQSWYFLNIYECLNFSLSNWIIFSKWIFFSFNVLEFNQCKLHTTVFQKFK